MVKKKKLSALESAFERLNDNLDEADLEQLPFPPTVRELELLQEYIDDNILSGMKKFRINSGRRKPETTYKRLKRDQKIILEAIQLLDDDVKPHAIANKIKKRLKLPLLVRHIRRIYSGK